MANFILIIYPMGDMGARDQCGLLNICFHNAPYNLGFDKFTIILVNLHTN
jgi:hypothetical protein